MKYHTSLFLLGASLFLSAILLSSCTKNKLTRATQTGANTFSCKVDGKVFKPSKEELTFSGPSRPLSVGNSSFDGFTLFVKRFSSSGISENMTINLPYLTTTGTYLLKTALSYGEYTIDYAGGPDYYTDNTHTGTVNITRCDNSNQIYSGTFSFTGFEHNSGKIVQVTDGRFDVKGR